MVDRADSRDVRGQPKAWRRRRFRNCTKGLWEKGRRPASPTPLDEIVAQLNESAPVKVGWGFVPLNLFAQTRIRLVADDVPAREVMRQILERLLRRATCRLNYAPTTKRYYLSFLLLADGRWP
ncbi:MAG TPA: hypothetical protein VF173_27600 [Thermoanaerobaculia bacterium]|nr:hypothetical protein [Thermoanaerobaculia bacterium]